MTVRKKAKPREVDAYKTVKEANAAGVMSGTLANGDTFGDEDDGPEGGHSEFEMVGRSGRRVALRALDDLVEVLQFYADPYKARDEYGEPVTVPDFYSELDFGSRAQEALAKQLPPRKRRRRKKPDSWPFRRSDMAELKTATLSPKPKRKAQP